MTKRTRRQHVARAAFAEPEFERAPVASDAVEQFRRRPPLPVVVEAAQVRDAGEDRVVEWDGLRLVGDDAPAAVALDLEPEQVVVAAAEQRCAEGGDEVHPLVGSSIARSTANSSRTAGVA